MKCWLAFALALVALAPPAPDRPAPKKIPIADGIVLFQTAPYGDVGLDGNSIAILSRDGVFVFDTNGTPAAAAAVLAEIRKLTDKPVRYVVNSHWHWDHWYGTETYVSAFPDLRVIAHEKTREMMLGPALAFNKPGLETQLPAYIQNLEKRAATARAATPPPADLPALERRLEEDRFFLEQKTNVHHTAANVTFSDRLEIHMGERRIQVLHYDRAVTPGDAFVYLPDEKILITGDLLINPISFALSCYPTEWLRTLEKIDAMDASVIVPGHGDPLRDKQLLHATMDVFRELLRRGREAKGSGMDPDQARAAIMPELHDLMVKITRDDPGLNQAFAVQLVDWYLHRVYDELNGPLSDAIAPIPPK
jgi:glyoxylase-like metal-dependent hydrolase (beta-lactamase superfamily II)